MQSTDDSAEHRGVICNIFLLIDFVWIAARGAVIALSDAICSYFLLSSGSAQFAPETNQSIIRYKLLDRCFIPTSDLEMLLSCPCSVLNEDL